MRVLLVEDDQALSQSLKKELERAGFAVDTAGDGVEGEMLGLENIYDTAILDLGLPKRSGLEVLKSWRSQDNTIPVIVLTARDAWHERVDGFKAGADDYLGKPFHVEELIARLNALIQRTQKQPGGVIKVGGITLDTDTQSATSADGRTYQLTGTEYRLLRYFLLHPGKILSKTQLTDHVYDADSDKDSNVIEVYVNRLRQKFGRHSIQTKRGQGYVFTK